MNELYHHGIKGMHWGVRRFQNSDGTLTSAGKKRYDSQNASEKAIRNAKKKTKKGLNKSQKEALKALALTGAGITLEIVALHAADKIIDKQYEDTARQYREYAERVRARTEEYQRRANAYREESQRRANEEYWNQRRKDREYWEQAQQRATGGSNNQNTNSGSTNSGGTNSGGTNSRGTNTRGPKSAAAGKSTERVKKYAGSTNLDPKKTQARVDELRSRVIKAQREGTLTGEMVDELQEAMAANRAAKASMAHSFGHVWRVKRDPDSLYHHGIKGMHWGIRRFQNSDGTLTDAGKRRQRTSDRQIRRDIKRQRKWNAKNASQLSDDELNAQINRLQKERQLKQLTRETVSPGRRKALDLVDRYGNQVLAAAVAAATTVYVTNKINPKTSDYDRMREQADAQRRLAKEGYYQKHYDDKGKPR